ncbi:MAG: SPFH domain-containing protein [Lachnospiraceae bacterium]|nr:SPFH domain-containing protein [Lachnospiraceae bacterium]
MQLFSSNNPKEKQHSGVLGAFAVDVIKWEPETSNEASIIVHKFEYEDFPNGSYLIVAPSQMAVFTNNLTAGNSLDADGSGQSQVSVFTGPCKIKLETGDSRFSPFRNISHALTGGESAFHSTVYFVNTTYMNELSWGTQDPIVVQDPEEEINVHVRAHGMYGVHIEKTDTSVAAVQARKFLLKVVGTRADYTEKELRDFMRARILEYVPNLLANRMIEDKIGVLKANAHLSEFSEIIFEKLAEHFYEFGLTLDNFSFHNINVPEEDLAVISEAKNKRRRAQLEAEGNAAAMDIESAARARMREREGYTYQQEQSFGVMQAAAENEGTSSAFMGAGMGLGMGFGVGGAMGAGMQSIAQQTIGSQTMQPASSTNSNTLQVACPGCGKMNPPDAKFCLNCGEKFSAGGNVCPDCGKEVPKDAKFCLNCGRKLSRVCSNCGRELESDAKFCPECGGQV